VSAPADARVRTTQPPGRAEARHPTLRADDPADQRLAALVHPADWVNPAPAARYHLVVVGAGTGGLVTAAAAAGLGARVALVERSLMGGDCLNVGCVPSKSVIRAARAWREARDARARFAGPAVAGDGDFAAAMHRLREVRAHLAPIDGAERFRGLGVDVFLGDGRFVAPDAVEVGGARLRFRRAVIAAGARAAVPDVPGLAESDFYTNETIFSLDRRPEHLVVLGAGPIGCELAQAFARLGVRVTVLDRGERVLAREEPEASAVVERAMVRDGVEVLHGAELRRVEPHGEPRGGPHGGPGGARSSTLHVRLRAGDRDVRLDADVLLVAAGRAPNVEGLGLDAAGVRFDARRGVEVDDRLRTANPRVYAVGDVCSPLKFTHLADFHARLVVQNALFFGRGRASALVTPWVTFTSPEVAHVGLTAEEARERGTAVDVVDVPFGEVDRAIIDDETEGFCRVLLAAGSDRIVGATLVGEHAGETIGEVALAMTNGLGLGAIGRTMHPYPTQAEALRKAADQWRRRKLTPRVKGLFAGYFRLLR
jgi:pyruvate/2-oxoglutarate dehydrogenase complex dihydrolipoamide dehydrogenase (E3) component